MKIGSEDQSERVTAKDFEKLTEEAAFAKPMVRRRVHELADAVITAMGGVTIANPVAEAVAALICGRCDTIRNRFRN
jgi:hypothetical protein